MRTTKVMEYRFGLDEFLDKLGINGDHVVSVDDVAMRENSVMTIGGNFDRREIILVRLNELQSLQGSVKI